jgi:hypothetical protein
MPLIECLDCKREISDRAGQCIHCGAPVSQRAADTHTGAVEPQITPRPQEFLGLVDSVNQDVSTGPLMYLHQLRDVEGYHYFTAPDVHIHFNDIDGQDQLIKVGDLVFFERKLNENGRLQKIRKINLPEKEMAVRRRKFRKANGKFVVNEERMQKWRLMEDNSQNDGTATGQRACSFCSQLSPIGREKCGYCGEIFREQGKQEFQAPASFSARAAKKSGEWLLSALGSAVLLLCFLLIFKGLEFIGGSKDNAAVLLLVLIVALWIYFLPWEIAFRRQHRNRGSIAVINLFFGWTLIVWIILLAWSFSGNVEQKSHA